RIIARTIHRPALNLVVFAILLGLTVVMLNRVPGGFIPHQDQGVLIAAAELPQGASIDRTEAVMREATRRILEVPGVQHAIAIPGLSGATFATSPSAGAMFLLLDPFAEREEQGLDSSKVANAVAGTLQGIQEAQFFVIDPPPVRGLGRGGGFKMIVEDRGGRGLAVLEQSVMDLVAAAAQTPGLERVFATLNFNTPQYYLDIDRTKAEMLNLPVENVFEALQVYLGSSYVNDFNLFGRTYRVVAQADAPYRLDPRDIARMHARNADGNMVPLGSVLQVRLESGADRLLRYNLYPAAEVQGAAASGTSTGDALRIMER